MIEARVTAVNELRRLVSRHLAVLCFAADKGLHSRNIRQCLFELSVLRTWLLTKHLSQKLSDICLPVLQLHFLWDLLSF